MTIGIYKIQNKINNKIYIGCSNNIEERWKEHKLRAYRKTKSNIEYDKSLYRSFRKYQIFNFDFEIIKECQKGELENLEIFYIEKYNSYQEGYNETIGGLGVKNNQGENHNRTKLTNDDIIYIRQCYNNHMDQSSVYNKFNKLIGKSGFQKIWNGYTWKHIMMEVYTQENKDFYKKKRNSNSENNSHAKLTEKDVINIRTRKKNGENINEVYKDYQILAKGSFKNVWYSVNWKHIKI